MIAATGTGQRLDRFDQTGLSLAVKLDVEFPRCSNRDHAEAAACQREAALWADCGDRPCGFGLRGAVSTRVPQPPKTALAEHARRQRRGLSERRGGTPLTPTLTPCTSTPAYTHDIVVRGIAEIPAPSPQ